jgi:hypothetical protein
MCQGMKYKELKDSFLIECGNRNLKVYENEYHPKSFGYWAFLVGNSEMKLGMCWDARDNIFTIDKVADDDSINIYKKEFHYNGGTFNDNNPFPEILEAMIRNLETEFVT